MRLNELIKIKNKNKDLKFILSIGNEADIEVYDNLCSNSVHTNQFIESIIDLIQLYELDGINFNLKFDSIRSDSNLSFLFRQNLMQMIRVSLSFEDRIQVVDNSNQTNFILIHISNLEMN